jgi:hypothetical protein
MADESKRTLVQHSGYAEGARPQFRYALETRAVTAAQARQVLKAGGLVYDGYVEAENAADALMYESGNTIAPRVPGEFSNVLRIDGLRVYLPPKDEPEEHRFEVTLTGCTADEAEEAIRRLFGKPGDATLPAGVDAEWGWQ